MKLLDYLDRAGERRLERYKISPPRPRDSRLFVGVLFFLGYYVLVFTMLKIIIPAENAPLVRDAMLVLGPVIGAIGQALFRTDLKDEIATQNTGEAFRANRAAAEATKAAADSIPNSPGSGGDVGAAAGAVAGAAADKAEQIQRNEGMETDV
jgi:hypothetical protein